jgi:hypothetical protein
MSLWATNTQARIRDGLLFNCIGIISEEWISCQYAEPLGECQKAIRVFGVLFIRALTEEES